MKKLDPVVQEMVDKTYREMGLDKFGKSLPCFTKPTPKQDSRNWQDPEGYRYLFPWSNAVLLRFLIRKFTDSLPKSEYRRKAQIDDAGRSSVRNVEEGFKRASTREYLEFLGFSQGSLEEVKGDIKDLAEDRFLKSVSESSLAGIGINLRDFRDSLLKDSKGLIKESNHPLNSSNHPLKSSNGPLRDFSYHPLTILYPPLNKIQAEDLTYEIFLELINKTDYLLRQLVISLENKLNIDQKGYQVDQIRLNRRARGD